MEEKKCESCGMPVGKEDTKCKNCGAKVPENVAGENKSEEKQDLNSSSMPPNHAPIQEPLVNGNVPPASQIPYGTTMHQESMMKQQPEYISMGNYLIMMLIALIPIVNIIVYCIWAFSKETMPNKKNFARAQLVMVIATFIFQVILIIVMIVFVSAVSTGTATYGDTGGYYDYYYDYDDYDLTEFNNKSIVIGNNVFSI